MNVVTVKDAFSPVVLESIRNHLDPLMECEHYLVQCDWNNDVSEISGNCIIGGSLSPEKTAPILSIIDEILLDQSVKGWYSSFLKSNQRRIILRPRINVLEVMWPDEDETNADRDGQVFSELIKLGIDKISFCFVSHGHRMGVYLLHKDNATFFARAGHLKSDILNMAARRLTNQWPNKCVMWCVDVTIENQMFSIIQHTAMHGSALVFAPKSS